MAKTIGPIGMPSTFGLSLEDLPPTPETAALGQLAQSLGRPIDDIERALEFLKSFDPDDPWKGASLKLESEVAPPHLVTSEDLKRQDGKPKDESATDMAVKFAKPTVTLVHPLFGTKVIAPAGRASRDGWKKNAGIFAGIGVGAIVGLAGAGFVAGWLFGRRK